MANYYKEQKQKLNHYLQYEKLKEAEELIRNIEMILRNDVEFTYLLVVYYRKSGRLDKALAIAQQGLFNVPNNFRLLYSLWEIYFEKDDYIKAFKYYLEAYVCYVMEKDENLKQGISFDINEIQRLVLGKLEVKQDRQQSMMEVSKVLNEFKESLKKANPKTFPNMDSNGTETCLGKFFEMMGNKYYVGYYQSRFNSKEAEVLRVHNKCEIFRANLQKELLGIQPEKVIIPIASLKPNTVINVELGDKKQVYSNKIDERMKYDYYKIEETYNIKANKECVMGNPIKLKNNKANKDLVMTLFIDGLSYKLLEEVGIEQAMPYTSRYFKDGCLCTNVYAGSEWTLPSVATICTGQYPTHHKLYHHERKDSLPEEIETLFESFKKQGYVTGKIDGNWRTTPTYGYIRGLDRVIYAPATKLMDANYVIGEAIAHLETFKGANQYLWLGFMDLHKIPSDLCNYSILEQSQVPVQLKSKNVDNEKSVEQAFDLNKKARYIQSLKQIDLYLENLYHYINQNYKSENVVVTLVSDHGQGYLIRDKKHFFEEERTKVPLLVKGFKSGRCDELISLADYISILAKASGIELMDMSKRDSRLPQFFEGESAREYTYTESIFQGKTYKASINTKNHIVHFETKDLVHYDGTVCCNEYSLIVIERNSAQEITSENVLAYYLNIIKEHMRDYFTY